MKFLRIWFLAVIVAWSSAFVYAGICPGSVPPVCGCQASRCPSSCYCFQGASADNYQQPVCCPYPGNNNNKNNNYPQMVRPPPQMNIDYSAYQNYGPYQPYQTSQNTYPLPGTGIQNAQAVFPDPFYPDPSTMIVGTPSQGSYIRSGGLGPVLDIYRNAVLDQIRRYPVLMYSATKCENCRIAKDLLNTDRIPFYFVDYDMEAGGIPLIQAVQAETGRDTLPQIFICGKLIGDRIDLDRLRTNRELVGRVRECAPDAVPNTSFPSGLQRPSPIINPIPPPNNNNNNNNNNNMYNDMNNNNRVLSNGFVEIPFTG